MKRKIGSEVGSEVAHIVDTINNMCDKGKKFVDARKQTSAFLNGLVVTNESLNDIVHALSTCDIQLQKRFLHFICRSAVESKASTSPEMWRNMRQFVDIVHDKLKLGEYIVLEIIKSLERSNAYTPATAAFGDNFVHEPQFAPVCIINDDLERLQIVFPFVLESVEPKSLQFQVETLGLLCIRHAALACFSWLTKMFPQISYIIKINDMTPDFVTFYFRDVLKRGATDQELMQITNMETLLAVAKVIHAFEVYPQTMAPAIYKRIADIDFENKNNPFLFTLKKRHFISMTDLATTLSLFPMTEVIALVLMKFKAGCTFLQFGTVVASFTCDNVFTSVILREAVKLKFTAFFIQSFLRKGLAFEFESELISTLRI